MALYLIRYHDLKRLDGCHTDVDKSVLDVDEVGGGGGGGYVSNFNKTRLHNLIALQ